jgi:hypothetical protein
MGKIGYCSAFLTSVNTLAIKLSSSSGQLTAWCPGRRNVLDSALDPPRRHVALLAELDHECCLVLPSFH